VDFPSLKDQYLKAKKQIHRYEQMEPSAVVMTYGFPLRAGWIISRLLPEFTRLEQMMSDEAGKLLAEGKTVRLACSETGLPRRKVEQISKQVQEVRRSQVRQIVGFKSIPIDKSNHPLDLWINVLLFDHDQKITSAGLPPIRTIS
jgi:hypothetical protein